MIRSIVFKLFLLTTALCMLIVAVIFVGQTVFFKQFYMNKKVSEVEKGLESYRQDYVNHQGDEQAERKLEEEFYNKHNTWITTLDAMGNMKNTDDYEIELQLERFDDSPLSNKTVEIPLYSLVQIEDVTSDDPIFGPVEESVPGQRVSVDGLMIDGKLVPLMIDIPGQPNWGNMQLENKQFEVVPSVGGPEKFHEKFPSIFVYGTVKSIRLPQGTEATRYTNHLFLDRIKAFQADLLLASRQVDPNSVQVIDYTENEVKYRMFVERVNDGEGHPEYIFAMTSLQPVDEAIQVIKDYYVYILVGVLLLTLLASFYFSKRIAGPLLRINKTTRKIASLDFSEKIPISTKDEIGDLSRNINELSETLHSHIEQLQQDIEKEKQLERTRKEFISGVSHELKTPLSVIQSCISILKDGIAEHKRTHYFEAMEQEVARMNLLIVDMLELAKFESGTYQMQMEAFPIDSVITRLCDQLSMDMQNKQLRLSSRLLPVEVIGNRHRIEQVITNLLTNAIRYTPEKQEIKVSTIIEGDTVTVYVENSGAHIPEENLEKIWDRFYRGEPSRQRSQGGTGLGLAISKKILDLHGAAYGVTNTEAGVLFYFRLHRKV